MTPTSPPPNPSVHLSSCRACMGTYPQGMSTRRRACCDRSGWCGLCYSNLRGRSNWRGHAAYRSPSNRKACHEMLARRNSLADQKRGLVADPPCPARDSKMVDLWDFLTATHWPDGTERAPGSLTIFCDAGVLKGCLSDKDAGLVCFLSGADLVGLLGAAARAAGDAGGDWRPQRTAVGGKAGKRA